MNSVKNAIVTVTLLAVGYGSYIVLSEPQPGQQQAALDSGVAGLPRLDIQQSTPPQLPNPGSAPSNATAGVGTPADAGAAATMEPINLSPVTIAPVAPPAIESSSVTSGATPSVPGFQLAAPPEVTVETPKGPEFPDLLPLPEMTPVAQGAPPEPVQLGPPEVASAQHMDQDDLSVQAQPVTVFSADPRPSLAPPLVVGTQETAPTSPSSDSGELPAFNGQAPANEQAAVDPDAVDPGAMAPDATHPAVVTPTTIAPTTVGPTTTVAPLEPALELGPQAVAPQPGNQFASPSATFQPTAPPPTMTSDEVAPALDRAATAPGAPAEIDVQPVESSSTPSPLLPSIDPSVGPIPPAPSEGSVAFEKAWSETQALIRSQSLPQALQTLTPWAMDQTMNQEQQARCIRMLDELAGGVVYSRTNMLEPAHVVQAGQTLDEIAAAYAVPLELLAKINGIPAPYALSTGESLKVIRGPFHADVSVSKQQLTLFTGNYYAGRFRIEVGPDLPREETVYEVGEKSRGRSYFDRRSGTEVPQGQEDNRYGDHWIGLRGEHITTGHSVGIHGRPKTRATDDVGCICLDAIDAADLFSILSVGSKVQIRR